MNHTNELNEMLSILRRYYSQKVIDLALGKAESYAIRRGDSHISIQDWDAMLDDEPIDGTGIRIVSSDWVEPLLMIAGEIPMRKTNHE